MSEANLSQEYSDVPAEEPEIVETPEIEPETAESEPETGEIEPETAEIAGWSPARRSSGR